MVGLLAAIGPIVLGRELQQVAKQQGWKLIAELSDRGIVPTASFATVGWGSARRILLWERRSIFDEQVERRSPLLRDICGSPSIWHQGAVAAGVRASVVLFYRSCPIPPQRASDSPGSPRGLLPNEPGLFFVSVERISETGKPSLPFSRRAVAFQRNDAMCD